ncbi:MAG: hypothetical protein V9E81_08530 [Marmoricola sp.]
MSGFRFGVLLVVAALSAGCASTPSPATPTHDAQAEYSVAANPNASAQDIAKAGIPVSIATSQDRTLITYRARSDDDEGPQIGAWVLADADLKTIASGTFKQVTEMGSGVFPTGLADGFLLQTYTSPYLVRVDLDGDVHQVPQGKTLSSTKAGDLLMEIPDGFLVYRDSKAYPLPKLRSAEPPVLAPDGSIWQLVATSEGKAVIKHSTGNLKRWKLETVKLPGKTLALRTLTASADGSIRMLSGEIGEYDTPQMIWSRETRPGGTWHSTPLSITSKPSLSNEVVLVHDTLGVLVDERDLWLLAESEFTRLDLPTDSSQARVFLSGDQVYCLDRLTAQLWRADGLTGKWTELAVSE